MLKQKVKEKIMLNAVSLAKYGLNDLAWSKQDAKNLIQLIMKDSIGILGGDVYQRESGRLRPLCDNWSCEPMFEESDEGYYSRSKLLSLNYIENYPIRDGEDVLFSITFTEHID